MKMFPEGDIQKLTDHLKGVMALNKPMSEENCTNCGQQGHSEYNCWGNCPACGELVQGHVNYNQNELEQEKKEGEIEKEEFIIKD